MLRFLTLCIVWRIWCGLKVAHYPDKLITHARTRVCARACVRVCVCAVIQRLKEPYLHEGLDGDRVSGKRALDFSGFLFL